SSGTYRVRDVAATLLLHCREWLGDEVFGQLIFVTGCRQAVEEYTAIFSGPVHLAPMPQPLPIPRLRKRAAGEPHSLTVGFLGHQRTDKGYQIVPALTQHILHRHPNVRVLVQQSEPGTMKSTSDEIARLAHDDKRVELILRPFTAQDWFALLDRCDIIALPYTQTRYETSASAILGEALASGAPVVVPARTTLSSVVDDLDGPGTTFDRWESPSIASGIAEAIDRFDELAKRAFQAGRRWRERHGPDHFARAVLALAAQRPGASHGLSTRAANRHDLRIVVD